MATTYRAKAVVVKVSVGPSEGNRVARIIKQGGIIPEGVEKDQLARLEKLNLIEKVDVAAEAKAEAQAAETKATADAEAEAKAAAAAKTTPTK